MRDTVGSKNTKDRVNIKAEVETAKGLVKVKVPFVMGVMADLSGAAAEQLPSVDDRQFVDFNQQNFNQRLEAMAPTVKCNVANTLSKDGSSLSVDLKIKSMNDFTPGAIARQVDPLRRLLFVRNKLKEILANTQGNAQRDKTVKALLSKLQADPAVMGMLKEVGIGTDAQGAK